MSKTADLTAALIASIAVILFVAVLFGYLAEKLHEPPVIGQIAAGIALGPSLVGRLPGHLTSRLFPASVLPILSEIAQVALIMFIFSVGCELNLDLLRRRRRSIVAVSTGAFLTPMALGSITAVILLSTHGEIARHHGGSAAFVVYFAVALSITAVPVLAGILKDWRLDFTPAGIVSLTAAGVMDVAGWFILAILMAATSGRPVVSTCVLSVAYVIAMVAVVRPLLRWWLGFLPETSAALRTGTVTAAALASSWVTAELGLQVIFGALFLGLLMPRRPDGQVAEDLLRPVNSAAGILLPVFFITAGLSVNLETLHADDVLFLLIVTLVALAGKLGGGLAGARVSGMGWLDAYRVGTLVNTRGLTELIALQIGLAAGFIDTRMYTVLVLMALILTAATGPLLSWAGMGSRAIVPNTVAAPPNLTST
jgi:Kef-type K+ transport system membrane component KefB